MTGAFVSKRRAERFDALLSNDARMRHTASPDAELVDLVGSLRSVAPVSARPDFVSDLRSQLVVEAARMARPVVDDELRLLLTPRQRHTTRDRRVASVLGGFAIAAATGSMALASQAALPGDVLYPVKRAIENAQTNLESSDAAKAQTLIAHAELRLQEAEQLTAEGADAAPVAATLQDFTHQANQATELALDDYAATGDQTAIAELRSFADEAMADLDDLGDAVPVDARPALITAAQSVLQADSAAFQLCPTCGNGPVTELPEFATAAAVLVSDLDDLLSLQPTLLSVDLDEVEAIADAHAEKERRTRTGTAGGDGAPSTTGTAPDDATTGSPPDVDVPNNTPIHDLGDKIKKDLGIRQPGQSDTTVDGVVDGLTSLVDGIIGY